MDKATQLADLVEQLLAKVDEEAEHGCYETPQQVPFDCADEDDYYARHDEIVNEVVDLRVKVRNLIAEIRKGEK